MKTERAMLTSGILAVLGVGLGGVFGVLAGFDYARMESQGLEGPTPSWMVVGMAVGAGVALISFMALIVLIVGWALSRRRTN